MVDISNIQNPLEQWALHRLSQVVQAVKQDYDAYHYGAGFNRLFDFCTNDLSSFYFDVRKDMLYCNGADCPERKAFKTVIHTALEQILKLIAPICPFTASESWGYGFEGDLHLTQFNACNFDFADAFAMIENLRDVRRVVTSCLEQKRAAKEIGASLEAKPAVYIADKDLFHQAVSVDFADICITSGIDLHHGNAPAEAFILGDVAGVGVVFAPATGKKCARCWKILPDVNEDDLCGRCDSVVHG
jgi:isoleucyl-tRNA synthetase